MGFRSTFTTDDFSIFQWPNWFVEKWKDWIHFNKDRRGLLSPYHEGKTYGIWVDLSSDIQKAIPWGSDFGFDIFTLVYLHECGGITRIQISKDKIRLSEPFGWVEVDEITHPELCYKCDEIRNSD